MAIDGAFGGHIIDWLTTYRYLIIFPLAIVEGPVIMMICGFLYRLGYFDFWPLYLILMAGDLVADALWYMVGRHGAGALVRRWGYWFSITEELLQKTADAFHRHHNKILFLSKITMGFGFALAVLMTAGMVRVPFKKYMLFNAAGQFIWTGVLIGIGYAFGNLYYVVDKSLSWLTFVAFIIIVSGAAYGMSKYLRTKDLQNKL